MIVDGDLISRCELFDEADIDAAMMRFDELSRRVPILKNAATRTRARVHDAYNRRDLDGFVVLHDADGGYEDRRKGLHDSGPVDQTYAHALWFVSPTSWRSEFEPVAIRGSRLALSRDKFRDTNEVDRPIAVETLMLAEVTDAGLQHHLVIFDPDDIDSAFDELDARYIAGEAAPHAQTWSVVAGAYAALNRRELPATTRDWVSIDHRRGASVASGDMATFLRTVRDLTPQVSIYIEAVHRLSDLGAVLTEEVRGKSQEGFDAEWREIILLGVDGDLINRLEVFDEADIDSALARFDELERPAADPNTP